MDPDLLRHANAHIFPAKSDTASADRITHQEHLDLLASRSQISLPPTGATSVDAGGGGAQTSYELYWAAKAKQLK